MQLDGVFPKWKVQFLCHFKIPIFALDLLMHLAFPKLEGGHCGNPEKGNPLNRRIMGFRMIS